LGSVVLSKDNDQGKVNLGLSVVHFGHRSDPGTVRDLQLLSLRHTQTGGTTLTTKQLRSGPTRLSPPTVYQAILWSMRQTKVIYG
jgi:hypothetical protein